MAAVIVGAGLSPLQAQVSPGGLSGVHAFLDTNEGCFYCHSRGDETLNTSCRSCHAGIDYLIQRGRGLHGRESFTDCASCHPEHAGRSFDLIEWDEGSAEQFRHERTGFTLDGAHRPLDCASCHQRDNWQQDFLELVRRRHRGHDWIGLTPDCGSCHDDPHAGRLGTQCESCHSTEAFRPVPGFDHGLTRFPLTGRHVDVECRSCHPQSGAAAAAERYAPIAHADCGSCHEDAHAGRFGTACSSCHNTSGFDRIDPGVFDHEKTRFALRGAHRSISCESCHDETTGWGSHPPFATCNSCHEDAHAGTATRAGQPADCASCHTEIGF